jgi:L-alanine-DL-glutamate epimerase-like enolase superfamily enzyme
LKVSHHSFNLKFKYPFGISRGTKTHQPTFVIELEHMGVKGYGEAPAISYYHIPVEKMIEDLERKKIFVEKFAFTEPERWWHYCHHLFPMNNFLVCALDMAGWDIYGKMKQKPLQAFWQTEHAQNPVCDYTIGIDTIEKMVEKLKEKPWPIYKIKLGTNNDLGIMEELRKHTDAVFRVDANAAWQPEEALEKIKTLQNLGVELIEQPLAKDNWEGMKWLYENSPLPLYADESCVFESDVVKCKEHFHGINIKLTKCGGITPALRMIREARKLNLKVMVGAMNESTLGSAAIAHLLPLIDHVDADGPLLQDEDIATGLTYLNDGHILISNEPGLGIKFTGLYTRKI